MLLIRDLSASQGDPGVGNTRILIVSPLLVEIPRKGGFVWAALGAQVRCRGDAEARTFVTLNLQQTHRP